MTTRRAQVADAAIATLARDGLRGTTHRAVDRRAGLPEGSSSYYFRTRQALLEAAVARLAELDDAEVAQVDPLPPRLDVDFLAGIAARMVERATTTHRERALARYELSLESTRRPELRAALRAVGERYRELATALLAAAGAGDPPRQGRAFIAYLDGLIYDRVAGAGARPLTAAELHASLADLLRGFLTPGMGHPGIPTTKDK